MSIKKQIIFLFVLMFLSCLMIYNLNQAAHENTLMQKEIVDKEFRRNFYSEEMRNQKEELPQECRQLLDAVEKDAIYYPIPESSVDKSLKTSFVNTWMDERLYNGKTFHEGTDIMASENKRGLYPVLSMTSGTVTNIGWLEKGGYRIGITSESGIYYYYAHLDSYADLSQGDQVIAGEFLGYMGDSGYGKEGTKGEFPVHLHVGIYVYQDDMEISFNPYYVLCSLENNKLKYAYF